MPNSFLWKIRPFCGNRTGADSLSVTLKVVLLLVGMFFISFLLQKLFPPTAKDYEEQEKEMERKRAVFELEEKRRQERAEARKAKAEAKKKKQQEEK